MQVFIQLIVTILIGYLFGCSNMAYYIGKIKGIDLKKSGSKNYGASNTFALVGAKAGVIVFIHDFLKPIIAMLLTKFIFKDVAWIPPVTGAAVVVGHIFPFYAKFNGGKGYASFIGMSIMLHPLIGSILFLASVGFALITDYVVASTFFMIVAMPIVSFITGGVIEGVIVLLASILILIKHKDNIINLYTKNGKEMTIRSALNKKYKKENHDEKE